jgi:hypothetical protein
MSELANVNVSVPKHRIPELYAYAARLNIPDADDAEFGWDDAADEKKPIRAKSGFGKAAVRRAYMGGVSDYWRPFLDHLADNPDKWVAWKDLYTVIGMTDRQAAGMLGAAERRCKGKPPYEKLHEDGEYWFRMPAPVAALVTEFAEYE